MEERLRKHLWESMLQADQEQRYWHSKACQYVDHDRDGKIVLAVLSSGSVAGWAFWADVPWAWKLLSGFATLLSIVLPTLGLNSKVVAMTDLHGQWLQLKYLYEMMWRDQCTLAEKNIRERLESGKRKEAELSAKAISLPGKDEKLGAQTYHQVLQDWRDHE